MSRITIAGPKTQMKNVIDELHTLKIVHIEDYQKEHEGFDIGNPMEKSDKVSEVLLKIRSMRAQLPKGKKSHAMQSISLQKLEMDVLSAIERSKEVEQELSDLVQEQKELEPFAALGIGKDATEKYKSIKAFIGTVRSSEGLSQKIAYITTKFELRQAIDGKKQLIALFTDRQSTEKLEQLLAEHGFSELSTDVLSERDGDITAIMSHLQKEINELHEEKQKNDIVLKELSTMWSATLETTEKTLKEESEKLQAPLRFATTKNAFVVQGYIPSATLENLQRRLVKAAGNNIYLHAEEVAHDEKVPTALKNAKPVKPFEVLLDMFSLPSYHEFDPTILMFLVFPIFFGMMLGDIGYGLITLIAFSFMKRALKSKQARGLLNILILSSVSSIIFGYFFGEFFGLEHIFGYELVPVIHRLHDVESLFHISVMIGIVHLNLGLVLGFFNELHHHGFVKATLEKLSWIVMEIGAFGYLTHIGMLETFVGQIFAVPLGALASGILFAVGAIGIVAGEGIKGAIELPAIFSNTLSYARLMAVGLASAALAVVVNEMAGNMFRAGIIGIVGGIFVLLIGHGINVALGVLSPFLHSLRLHYVEFFGKFYHGGGKRYVPFGESDTDEA